MNGLSRLMLSIALMTLVTGTFADSPLTSTDFYQAYLDVPVVADHVEAEMNEDIFNILHSDEYEVDVKVAIINAMGWTFEGQDNAAVYMYFYIDTSGLDVVAPDDMSGEELLCLAYMVSMDDYFSMSPISPGGSGVFGMSGVELAEAAAERTPDDFTVRLISALILSQKIMDHDWGKVFEVVDFVMKEALDHNMRDEAIDIILDYIGLYSGY
ncbi:hypothetical protein DRQ25_18135 [Candidatus Fermentibacteria bacterium]|nr:MAG: hypothetical protein DRQ25_18135 [Candidatus Fermentibacteria bacterium]